MLIEHYEHAAESLAANWRSGDLAKAIREATTLLVDEAATAERAVETVVKWPEFGNPQLVCDRCGEALCGIDPGDSFQTLTATVADHGGERCVPLPSAGAFVMVRRHVGGGGTVCELATVTRRTIAGDDSGDGPSFIATFADGGARELGPETRNLEWSPRDPREATLCDTELVGSRFGPVAERRYRATVGPQTLRHTRAEALEDARSFIEAHPEQFI